MQYEDSVYQEKLLALKNVLASVISEIISLVERISRFLESTGKTSHLRSRAYAERVKVLFEVNHEVVI